MTQRHIAMNARLLARFGGNVTLSRTVPGVPDPNAPWIPVEPVVTSEAVRFIATEAGAEWVATEVVLAGDLLGIMAVPETLTPMPGDQITAGGIVYGILRAEPVHSDPGGVIHYNVQARI